MRPNNSFKPNLLRYTKHMAGKACHVFGSTTQVGLTQVLDVFPTNEVIDESLEIAFRKEGWIQFRDDSGNLVEHKISEAQLQQLEASGAIKKTQVVEVHVLDPQGDYTTTWEIGRDVPVDVVHKAKDPDSGVLYAITTYEDGKPSTHVCMKEHWLAVKAQFDSIEQEGAKAIQASTNSLITAILLHEIDSSEKMPRSFFGERILADLLYESDGWYGKTCSISRFAPQTLPIGTEVVGPRVSGHYIINAVRNGDDATPVQVEQIQNGGTFAIMLSPRNEPGTLQSANLFCPNSKCVNVCSLTYTKTIQTIQQMKAQNPTPGHSPRISWACNLCGAQMLVDGESFNNIYRL